MKTTLNNAIVCSTDYNYAKYLNTLLTTLKRVKSNIEVFVRLVDFTVEQVNEMKLLYDCNFIIDNPNLSNEKTLFKTKNFQELGSVYNIKNIKEIRKVLYSPRSFYTCHSRFKTINELLLKNYNVLSLDCDTIVLKNFDDIFNNITHDIYTVKNKDNDDIFSNEGFLLFKNTASNKELLKNINEYLFEKENYLNWDGDHIALHKFFNYNTQSIKLLDVEYKDKQHLDTSIMWSGDGKNKYEQKFASNLV